MSNVDPSREQEGQDGLGKLVRRVLNPGPSPEERLEEVLAERRRELDESAARYDASMADLERREELLRDSRASVERMLRLGRKDLETRENELADLRRELSEREAKLAEAEEEIAQRRQELGAVELKRATVERREREVAEREERLFERAPGLDLGSPEAGGPSEGPENIELAFVPGAAGYRFVEVALPAAARGQTVDVEGVELLVGRIGPSPLPGDKRRCAYLVPASG